MKFIIALGLGYLLGCIQTPYIIVKLIKKVDIRELGSKNAGASNATRVLGLKYGILIGLVDVLKAVAAVLITKYTIQDSTVYMLASGAACAVGHVFPVFLGFKGGKGVATTIGTLLAIDTILGVSAIAVIVLVVLLTNYVALGSVIVYVLLPIALYLLKYSSGAIFIAIFISVLGIWKHRGNINRLLKGTENKVLKR